MYLGKLGASTADMPLTSIDIKNDGYTVVLGTTKGKLLIVDLRQGSTPRQVISAHGKSVKCVRFQGNHEPSKVSRAVVELLFPFVPISH
jgi:WD40 repeat protein